LIQESNANSFPKDSKKTQLFHVQLPKNIKSKPTKKLKFKPRYLCLKRRLKDLSQKTQKRKIYYFDLEETSKKITTMVNFKNYFFGIFLEQEYCKDKNKVIKQFFS